jgi:hypothetical protein
MVLHLPDQRSKFRNLLQGNNINMKNILSVFLFLIVFAGLSGQTKFTDNRDGNVYRTVTVAGVTWMAENLKYKAKSGAFYFDNDSNEYDISNAKYFSYLLIDDKPVTDISRKVDIADIHGTEKSNKYYVRYLKD